MAAPTITAASTSESGHEVNITFSAAMNQVIPVTGLTIKFNGVAVPVLRYLWGSSTVLMCRTLRCATKTETVTATLTSANLSDVATSTSIANVTSQSITNNSTARPLRSHLGKRGRY